MNTAWPRAAFVGLLLIVAASVGWSAPAVPARAAPAAVVAPMSLWKIDNARSSIRFSAMQAGARFEGRFKSFKAAISFDAANLAAAHARVEIPVLGVDTRSADRDSALKSKDWFDPARFPNAVFEARRIRAEGNGFVADGELRIRDRTRPVRFTFTVTRAANGVRTLNGRAQLSRLAFGLGQGEFQSTEWVGDAVTAEVTIVSPS